MKSYIIRCIDALDGEASLEQQPEKARQSLIALYDAMIEKGMDDRSNYFSRLKAIRIKPIESLTFPEVLTYMTAIHRWMRWNNGMLADEVLDGRCLELLKHWLSLMEVGK